MWENVVICGKICGLLAIEHMALDGQFYFLVLFGWMPLIPAGSHACYESLAFHQSVPFLIQFHEIIVQKTSYWMVCGAPVNQGN